MNFREWIGKPVTSYDFDGVLHSDYPPSKNPKDFDFSKSDLVPNKSMIEQLKKDAKSSIIIIVTARKKDSMPAVYEFVKKNNLPVSHIYCSDMLPKWPILQNAKAIKHYDDSPEIWDELKDKDIELVKVVNGRINENDVGFFPSAKSDGNDALYRTKFISNPNKLSPFWKEKNKVDKSKRHYFKQ